MAKINCVDIELSIMTQYNYRENLIVNNVSSMMGLVAFETDMLVLTKSGYAHGFEIKTSKSDLKADFKKPQHTQINEFRRGVTGMERFYGKFKYFSYAVPEELKNIALEMIPSFCGLWVLDKPDYGYSYFYKARDPEKLFDNKWSDKDRYSLARLGAMRIFTLKRIIQNKS